MARQLRIEYEGAIYHLMNRGDRREPIVKGDKDRHLFLETLEEACEKTDWQIHAYCLMRNHFHLLVETPRANLVEGMRWFMGTYTARFNRRHRYVGHLFSGRYKSLIVDGSNSGYLRLAGDYVHLNPARAKLLKREQALRDFRWSSYPTYLEEPAKRPKWLRVDRVLGEHGIGKDSAAGRREFERRMEARRWEDDPQTWKSLQRGWYLGDNEFRQELLELVHQRAGEYHAGVEIGESMEQKAERLIAQELRKRSWKEADLQNRPKGDPVKIQLAQLLRKQTTMTMKWIAKRLCIGTVGHLSNRMYVLSKRNNK